MSHVQEEKKDGMPEAFILFRGQYDQPKDKVEATVFSFLNPLPPGAPRNRLGLAQWLVAKENPLVARVTVNRMWQEYFGAGIVRSVEDFGIMGEAPSHPELLDWLAVEFRDGGWDMKKLVRLIVTSATYRQAAVTTPAKLEKDPYNRLLARGPRFRMDAEMIRDYALAAAGALSTDHGRSGRQALPAERDLGRGRHARGQHPRVRAGPRRRALPAQHLRLLEAHGAPGRARDPQRPGARDLVPAPRAHRHADAGAGDAERPAVHRGRAPARAEGAGRAAATTPRTSITSAGGCSPARSPRPRRRSSSSALRDLRAWYLGKPDEAKALIAVGEAKADAALAPPELAAWTMVCNQLLNLDEVLNK